MKIAFLTSEYPHPKTGTSGGIGTSIMNLAKGLIASGNEVTILIYGQKQDEVFTENGIQFYRIKNIKIKGLSWYFTRKKIQKKINDLFSQKKIELVEVADWTGITSFIKTKCPIILKIHGSDTFFCHLENRKVRFINRFHEKKAFQNANAIVAVSEFAGKLTNNLFGLNRNFTVIPNAIDAAFFNPDENKNETKHPEVLYFGSIIRKKGLLELPLIFNEVIASNPDVRLVLVGRDVPDLLSGNDSTWKMMQPLFSGAAIKNVNYTGSVAYAEIKKCINNADVCVFPSFAEALPVSWLEAMALGKAIVASDIGWAKEIIDDTINGFLASPENHGLYAEKITTLLNNPEMNQKIGAEARKKVLSTFDLQVIAGRNLEFYKKLIQSR